MPIRLETPSPRPLCSPCALPKCLGSVNLTSGGSQEESEEHRPPAPVASLQDWGEAHVTVGSGGSGWGGAASGAAQQKRGCGHTGRTLGARRADTAGRRGNLPASE